jgi:hypothetical protein
MTFRRGEDEAGPEDDRRADAENRVKGDLDRHHREVEAAADPETLQGSTTNQYTTRGPRPKTSPPAHHPKRAVSRGSSTA